MTARTIPELSQNFISEKKKIADKEKFNFNEGIEGPETMHKSMDKKKLTFPLLELQHYK